MLASRLLRVSSPLVSSLHRVTPIPTKAIWLRTYAKATELTLPALSPTMEEGVIVEWSKKEGESFKAGDVLFKLQTDKSVLDVEAPEDGILAKIVVQANAPPQAINSLVGYVAGKGEDLSKLEYPAAKSKPAAQPQKQEKPQPQQPKQQPQQQSQQKQEKPQPTQKEQPKEKKEEPKEKKEETHHHSSEFMFPSVRRLLTENNLELSQVKATGPQGRVVKGDVLNAIKNKGNLPPPSKSASESKPTDSSSQPTPKPVTKPQSTTQNYEDIPNNNIRLVIAKRLTESKTKLPHLYVTAECNIDQLLAMRTRLNNEQKVKLSVNDFILKAAALTLRDIPAANATWAGEAIRTLKDVDVSVAVATDKGLITPIIKNTDRKGLATIATELKDLAARARTGSLKPQEFQGGSFSVSNLGMYGISHFSAVINPPQAAILAVGAGRQEIRPKPSPPPPSPPSPSPSPSSKPSPKPSPPPSPSPPSSSLPPPKPTKVLVNVVDVTLSVDSRVIDEALAGQFLERFQKYLSTPEMLVL